MLQSFAVSDPNIAAASTPTATKRERTASLGRPDMVEGFVFVAERLAEPDLEPSFIDDENPTFETDFTGSWPPALVGTFVVPWRERRAKNTTIAAIAKTSAMMAAITATSMGAPYCKCLISDVNGASGCMNLDEAKYKITARIVSYMKQGKIRYTNASRKPAAYPNMRKNIP